MDGASARSPGRMPRRDAELMARLLATFQVEADEHLVALRKHLLELAGAPSEDAARDLVQTTFRDMHTLKGAARSVGLRDVERVCASCEALLSALTRAGSAPSAGLVALLEEATAAIGDLVAGGPGTPVPNALLERLDRAVLDPETAGEAAPVADPAPLAETAPAAETAPPADPAPRPPRTRPPPPRSPPRRGRRRSGSPPTISTRSCGAERTCCRSSSPPTSGSRARRRCTSSCGAPRTPRTRWPS